MPPSTISQALINSKTACKSSIVGTRTCIFAGRAFIFIIYLSFLCLWAGAALLAQSPTSPLTVSLQASCFLGITLSDAEDVDAKGYTDHACQNQGPRVAPDLW